MTNSQNVIGIWDGHDAGVVLVVDGKIEFALNEERVSRRKLDVGFPFLALEQLIASTGISAGDVHCIALPTYDVAKTLTRCVPYLGRQYYDLRRRKSPRPSIYSAWKKPLKYKLTELRGNRLTEEISRRVIAVHLNQFGLGKNKIVFVDHHRAHAASAIYTSGFSSCAGLTIDGIGDGASASMWGYTGSELKEIGRIAGQKSLGIFFEHVTNLLNMRELEDEGKVMALANFARPVADEENPLLELFAVEGVTLSAKYGSLGVYRALKDVLWRYPSEQVAYMAQRVLEKKVVELTQGLLKLVGTTRVAYAGGVASNVKVNMLVRELPEVEEIHVFPHMGDGGIAAGAALSVANLSNRHDVPRIEHVFLGPEHADAELASAVTAYGGLKVTDCADVAQEAASLISDGEIVFWFQGRSEYGPRALGGRSILAHPGRLCSRDLLNMTLKQRVWYQPFCPSMLGSEAERSLIDYDGKDYPFMTSAFRVKPEKLDKLQAVVNIDGTTRPQILATVPEHPVQRRFHRLLECMAELTGTGAVLNTSFNLHGEPLVLTVADALSTFTRVDAKYLVVNNTILEKC